MFERTKKHLTDNKKSYIIGGSCLVAGGVVGAAFASDVRAIQIVDAIKIQVLSRTTNYVSLTVEARGHRGNPVWDNVEKKAYGSVNQAAKWFETNAAAIKDNRIPGHDFVVFGENLTEQIKVPA